MQDLPQIPLYHGVNTYVSPVWMQGMTPPRAPFLETLWIEYWRPK